MNTLTSIERNFFGFVILLWSSMTEETEKPVFPSNSLECRKQTYFRLIPRKPQNETVSHHNVLILHSGICKI